MYRLEGTNMRLRNTFLTILFLIGSFYAAKGYFVQSKVPIVFHPYYDIGFFGVEKLHSFDSKKYGKVYKYLCSRLYLTEEDFYKPERISDADLRQVMKQKYIESLTDSRNVAVIMEMMAVALLPNFLVQRYLLDPMRYATDGTIKATLLALDPENTNKCAINLSGGYHHARDDRGEGFCVFPDIQLACKRAWSKNPKLKILYVDFDAHQGNGVEITLEPEIDAGKFVVFDIYGNDWPWDSQSLAIRDKIAYNFPFDLHRGEYFASICGVDDALYLDIVYDTLPKAIKEVKPDLIFYNAGTDPYKDDQLGGMRLTKEGIIARDAFVFQTAKDNSIPIVMTLSGGYSSESARIIGESIENILTNIMHIVNILQYE
jgi:histone deacetylase 11